MAFQRYPITDFNNLNVDWMIGQLSEQTTDIDNLEAGVTANADAIAQEVLDRQTEDAGLQYQIDNIIAGTAQVKDRTLNINSLRQMVVVTDSFGSYPNVNNSFVEEAMANLNIPAASFQKIYQAGSGFYLSDTSKRFYTMIQNAAISLTPDEVTDFVFVGGNNDLGAGLGDIRGEVVNCAQWVHTNYVNAKVWIIFDAWRPLSGPHNLNPGNFTQITQKAYQEGAALEGSVFATVAPAMHGIDLLLADGVHPSATGVIALGKAVAEVLAGSPNPTGGRTWAQVTVTPGSIVTALDNGWMLNCYNGDMIEIMINPGYTWTVNSGSWRCIGMNRWYGYSPYNDPLYGNHVIYEVGPVTAAFFNSTTLYPFEILAPCTFECTDTGADALMDGFVNMRFDTGKLYCFFIGDAMRHAGTSNEGWAKISKVHFKGGSWTLSALNN